MTKIDYAALKAELKAAFLKAGNEMGSDVKNLSWFGRNHKKADAE
jgi:hypothetical protein